MEAQETPERVPVNNAQFVINVYNSQLLLSHHTELLQRKAAMREEATREGATREGAIMEVPTGEGDSNGDARISPLVNPRDGASTSTHTNTNINSSPSSTALGRGTVSEGLLGSY